MRVLGTRCLLLSLFLTLGSACASSAQVSSSKLPVRRVVIYRNGVAYFERAGEVEANQVQFRLRQENIGDFLATLAVMERGGHRVRTASFPVNMDEENRDEHDSALSEALDSWDGKKKDSRQMRTVTLELDGKHHELTVGYLAETPLWRPSYRLLVGDKGEATLQAWGIVQNQSGEDWENVELALVAGAPIAFESTLGDPVIPQRPIITDAGEVISGVPEGSSSYRQDESEEDGAVEPIEMQEEGRGKSSKPRSFSRKKAARSYSGASPMSADAEMMAPPRLNKETAMAPREESHLARVETQTGASRYEIPYRVSIPDKSATMVLLVSKKVPGEAVFLFAPDGGVADSARHPFRVARFKNESGGILERGPIAVFEKGAFLGQGLVESLAVDAEATVPFALIRSLSITSDRTRDQRGARLYSVKDGVLTVERDEAVITEYSATNGAAERARVLVRHEIMSGARIWQPKKGTRELAGENTVLVPVEVPAYGKASLLVEERRPIRRRMDWQSPQARNAIRDFIKTQKLTESKLAAFEAILEHTDKLSTLADRERGLHREQRELEKSTRETRLSLRAIEKNGQAAKLRRELTKRLGKGTQRLETITKELIEIRLARTEQEVRLKEARMGLKIAPPDRRR